MKGKDSNMPLASSVRRISCSLLTSTSSPARRLSTPTESAATADDSIHRILVLAQMVSRRSMRPRGFGRDGAGDARTRLVRDGLGLGDMGARVARGRAVGG